MWRRNGQYSSFIPKSCASQFHKPLKSFRQCQPWRCDWCDRTFDQLWLIDSALPNKWILEFSLERRDMKRLCIAQHHPSPVRFMPLSCNTSTSLATGDSAAARDCWFEPHRLWPNCRTSWYAGGGNYGQLAGLCFGWRSSISLLRLHPTGCALHHLRSALFEDLINWTKIENRPISARGLLYPWASIHFHPMAHFTLGSQWYKSDRNSAQPSQKAVKHTASSSFIASQNPSSTWPETFRSCCYIHSAG